MIVDAMRHDTVIRAHMALKHPNYHTTEELKVAQIVIGAFELIENGEYEASVSALNVLFETFTEETFPKKIGSLANLFALIQPKIKSAQNS